MDWTRTAVAEFRRSGSHGQIAEFRRSGSHGQIAEFRRSGSHGQIDRVLLASPRSFCAGVEMAIKALAWMVRLTDRPVYCYHEIVHNQVVVDRFREAGVVFVDNIADVPAGAPLMLSAHGSAPEVVEAARARSGLVVDAACPLVRKVHHEVRRRAGAGHTVVYAGHATHDEALGTLAVAPDHTRLVEHPADVAGLAGVTGPVAFVAQTTLALDDWEDILAATRDRYGEVWVPERSDLCFATTNRQAAVKALAPQCDAVVVIGSDSSSNTRALAKVAEAAGARRVTRVNGPDELPVDLSGTVGVTAGASAPEEVVQLVLERLAPTHGIEVVEVTTEDEYFPPPRELRDLARAAGAGAMLADDPAVAASDVLRDLPRAEPRRPLDRLVHDVDRYLAALVEREVADPWLRQAIGYHLGWLDESFVPVDPRQGRPGGKKMRARLALLSCEAAAAQRTTTDGAERVDQANSAHLDPALLAVPFAAAVELVHNWSLVHDDIEDGDRTRRGRPTLWTLCGIPQAINVGDCLYGLAFRSLDGLGERGVSELVVAVLTADLARSAVELTVGQTRDMAFEATTTIDTRRYLEMIDGKTGALMRCATFGGALVGSADLATARAFGEFGRQLGLGFQIRDDVLGIWGPEAETGKPTGADIRRRKKSLPIVLAFDGANSTDRARLVELYTRDTALEPVDEREVRRILDRCGAHDLAQDHADLHRAAALAALGRALPASSAAATTLGELAEFVTARSH